MQQQFRHVRDRLRSLLRRKYLQPPRREFGDPSPSAASDSTRPMAQNWPCLWTCRLAVANDVSAAQKRRWLAGTRIREMISVLFDTESSCPMITFRNLCRTRQCGSVAAATNVCVPQSRPARHWTAARRTAHASSLATRPDSICSEERSFLTQIAAMCNVVLARLGFMTCSYRASTANPWGSPSGRPRSLQRLYALSSATRPRKPTPRSTPSRKESCNR